MTTERSATPRRRQRRITWATTAALGGLAVASLALVSGRAGPARPTVVAATQSEDVSTLADADHNDDLSGNLCPAGDLRASAAPGGVGSGITTTVVTLVNTGTTSCGLRGHAQLIGLSASGEHMALDAPTTGTPGTQADLLGPGAAIKVVIRTGSACLSEVVTYPSVILRLPHGGDVRIDNLNLATRCGVSLSHFGNLSGSAGVPAPGSAATLDALVELSELDLVPPRAATTLYYQVVLTNPTATAVSLEPCPVFEQAVFWGSSHAGSTANLRAGTLGAPARPERGAADVAGDPARCGTAGK